MPGRLEFETEYENEAETLIKDMEFGKVYQFGGDQQPAGADVVVAEVKPEGGAEGDPGEESEGELDLKLAVMEVFNERYDRRVASKDLIFDRGLVHYKTVSRRVVGRGVLEADSILHSASCKRTETLKRGARPHPAHQGLRADPDGQGSRGLCRRPFVCGASFSRSC